MIIRFHCPECGFGDHEVGHLARETEIHCIVCLEEEHGRLIRVHCWGGGTRSGPLARRFGCCLSRRGWL